MSTSPCGLGGPTDPSGPCSGTIAANQAGGAVFTNISNGSVIGALLGAALLLAGLVFVVWVVRKVAGFFGSAAENRRLHAAQVAAAAALNEGFDWSEYHVARSYMPDVDQGADNDGLLGVDAGDDTEVDTEDDSPMEDEEAAQDLESGTNETGDDPDAVRGDGMTDAEYDAFEWREEWKRENGEAA